MKLFKREYKNNEENLSDEDRINNLETRISYLSHYVKLMARGYLILFVAIIVTFYITENNVLKGNREEEHTKEVQIAGGPVAVCLLDAMKNVAPLLEKIPTVQMPLESYVFLQSDRYSGVKCPEPIK
jgi:hypothetical protein